MKQRGRSDADILRLSNLSSTATQLGVISQLARDCDIYLTISSNMITDGSCDVIVNVFEDFKRRNSLTDIEAFELIANQMFGNYTYLLNAEGVTPKIFMYLLKTCGIDVLHY